MLFGAEDMLFVSKIIDASNFYALIKKFYSFGPFSKIFAQIFFSSALASGRKML